MCGKCGEKLLGKSAYSSNGKRFHYYFHRSTCTKVGLNRINAGIEVVRISVENTIIDLEAAKEQLGEKQRFFNYPIEELKGLLANDSDLFT